MYIDISTLFLLFHTSSLQTFFYCIIPFYLLLLSFHYPLFNLFTISVVVYFSQRISHV